jgi:DnaB-like helicase C terminal domain
MYKNQVQTPPISENLKNATEILIGAILRSPNELHKHIARIPAKRALCCGGYAPVLNAIINQYLSTGKVSYYGVDKESGQTGSLALMHQNTSIQIDFAVDVWVESYEIWAEQSAMSLAMIKGNETQNANELRAEYQTMKDHLNAVTNSITTDWRDEFQLFVDQKIAGNEPKYKTVNTIPGYREMVPYFEPGVSYLFAARPSMGKSHGLFQLMQGFAENGAKGVCYSLEMPGRDIAKRLLSYATGVNHRDKWVDLPDSTKAIIQEKAKQIINSDYEFISNIALPAIEADAYSRWLRGDLDYITLDHIGLTDTGEKNQRDANARLSEISRRLVLLGQRLNIPVIILAQLSRAVEVRGGAKRPILSDLRDSGSLEQDFNTITFLYRAEYYEIKEDSNGQSTEGIAEFITLKNRNDITGSNFCGYSGLMGFFCTEKDMRDFYQSNSPYKNVPTQPAPSGISEQEIYKNARERVDTETIPF